jgi:hypothetical protein
MKITSLVSRYLLGLVFVVFGLNGFLHFLPMVMPTGSAGQFMAAVFESHYITVVYAIQLIGGLLLLLGQYVPLALTLLAPVIVNIIMFHAFMQPEGLPLAAVATILWLLVAYPVRSVFAALLQRKVAV